MNDQLIHKSAREIVIHVLQEAVAGESQMILVLCPTQKSLSTYAISILQILSNSGSTEHKFNLTQNTFIVGKIRVILVLPIPNNLRGFSRNLVIVDETGCLPKQLHGRWRYMKYV